MGKKKLTEPGVFGTITLKATKRKRQVVKQVEENEWIKPVRRNYRLFCCHCNNSHLIDFDLLDWARGKAIIFRVRRDPKSRARKLA